MTTGARAQESLPHPYEGCCRVAPAKFLAPKPPPRYKPGDWLMARSPCPCARPASMPPCLRSSAPLTTPHALRLFMSPSIPDCRHRQRGPKPRKYAAPPAPRQHERQPPAPRGTFSRLGDSNTCSKEQAPRGTPAWRAALRQLEHEPHRSVRAACVWAHVAMQVATRHAGVPERLGWT